jgi:hypothetical protein
MFAPAPARRAGAGPGRTQPDRAGGATALDDRARTDVGYDRAVHMSETELARRLAEADRVRATLRRCTVEWRTLGDRILAERQRGSERPDDRRAPRR